MFNFFRRRRAFDDAKKQEFADGISMMLKLQLTIAGDSTGASMEDAAGNLNPKALGYIYGFIDAALSSIGQDMADVSVGIPITFHVLRKLFPGREEKYLSYLIDNMPRNETVNLAAHVGGQQYMDFMNGKLASPTGLARYVLQARE